MVLKSSSAFKTSFLKGSKSTWVITSFLLQLKKATVKSVKAIFFHSLIIF